jgi:hypothetical protein
MAGRRTVGERRRCSDGAESDENKNCFHEHSPDLWWPGWLKTEAMTAVHGLFFPARRCDAHRLQLMTSLWSWLWNKGRGRQVDTAVTGRSPFPHAMGPVDASPTGDWVIMIIKLGIAVLAATVVVTDSARAFQVIRRMDQTRYDYSRRFLFLNTDVNRHYGNEVIFAGRYLGADPDPGIRLNLRVDRPRTSGSL